MAITCDLNSGDLEGNGNHLHGLVRFNGMKTEAQLTADDICKEISDELQNAARSLSGGVLSPDRFRRFVDELERQKLKRHGFTLTSSVTDGRLVHFTLRFADTDELCASIDVDPMTGKLKAHHACN